MLKSLIKFFLENKLVTSILLLITIIVGVIVAPFNWKLGFIESSPVPVDAIPNIGENQQIVYTQWPGRSPQDIEDQISYPLTTALLGIPGVKDIRANSIFGLSSIYIIFNDKIDFYWSRTRILEKLNSLPQGTLPKGVKPKLGPDATGLGQIFWYTLEGRDTAGNPAGGWDPEKLRTIQDFYVKYALSSVPGVAEVASIGGFVREYQIDIDPNALKAYKITLPQVIDAVRKCNLDIGARTIEINRVEYMIRSLGYIKNIKDLENSVVAVHNGIPVLLKNISKINFGPAERRGGLDKDGSEAVGGVVVARYNANPLKVINAVKEKIKEISNGLPEKRLRNGKISKVTIIPFYDRSNLIKETLGTLEQALSLEILISIIVILVLVMNLRASFLISTLLPLGVLMTFIAMKYFGVEANIMALSGIAIAIGVMVDVGIVFTENIIRHLSIATNQNKKLIKIIYEATIEVAPAVLTSIATTVVSFLPVFSLQAAEGKLFRPLAFTKTFVMISAFIIGFMFLPMIAHWIFSIKIDRKKIRKFSNIILTICGISLLFFSKYIWGTTIILLAINNFFADKWTEKYKKAPNYINIGVILSLVLYFLTTQWLPIGASKSLFINFIFVAVLIASLLGVLSLIIKFYPQILKWALRNKFKFLLIPLFVIFFGITIWQGFDKIFVLAPKFIKKTNFWLAATKTFPGIGKEFMPTLNEGAFLFMPTTMPHSGIEENISTIRLLDKKIQSIPEIKTVVGKWGRVNSALDPAPISMFENIILYKSEYVLDNKGHRKRFKINKKGAFILKNGTTYNSKTDGFKQISASLLIADKHGKYFRQWRNKIKSTDDIWKEIVKISKIPGLTSAPKLQPIQTRLIMLQTGMRAPMGIKIYGPNLKTIEKFGLELEKILKQVKGVESSSVFADRVIGKPYIEIIPDRLELARYGIKIADFQKIINSAIGGINLTTSIEGRERFPIRIRYAREMRNSPENLKKILISNSAGQQIPLIQLAKINYIRGPQMIKSENTFLVSYVIFDKKPKFAEVNVVQNAKKLINKKIKNGTLKIPAGITFKFTGNYEKQIRATKRLMIIIPLSLIVIFLILYFQFRSVISSSLIFSGILVAFSGGFIMLWLYAQPWFMNFSIAGQNIRNLFSMGTINLSVAVWVGFIALFGIATDDGVLISTYLKQIFETKKPKTIEQVRANIVEAGMKRVRPAIMTTATTLIALLPVLSSNGKGSEIMTPMAIPIFGGMFIASLTIFVVPVLYSLWQETKLKNSSNSTIKN
jgi:Cu(I)/Ag(I) efflux system membrane protein CusA/SilA